MSRRAGAVALGLALAMPLIAVPVAVAQTGVSTRLAGVSSNATVTGSVSLRAEASAATGVRRIELSIGDIVVARHQYDNLRSEVSISHRWDSHYYPASSRLGPNREYVVRVSAVSQTGATDSTSVRVKVDNLPTAPAGVFASSKSDTVTVSWNPNPEPDIVGYQVRRDGVQIADVTGKTTYSEKRAPGKYSYQIVALRSSSTSSDPLASPPSSGAGVTVAAPPAAAKRSGGGGVDGGARSGSGRSGGGAVRSSLPGGRSLGSLGLPPGVSLPPRLDGLPGVPSTRTGSFEWGTYKDTLPYDLDGTGRAQLVPTTPANIAARSPARVIPPDGLRWVAAGLLLLVSSGLLRMLALRLDAALGSGEDGAPA